LEDRVVAAAATAVSIKCLESAGVGVIVAQRFGQKEKKQNQDDERRHTSRIVKVLLKRMERALRQPHTHQSSRFY